MAAPSAAGTDPAPRRGGGGARRRARASAVQALYQWQMTGQDAAEIESQFLADRLADDSPAVDRGFFRALLHGVVGSAARLDGRIEPLLDRPMAQVDPVECAVLRIGAFELVERLEIPTRVVINEAVELAKTFGGENGHRYVNGVLDRLARDVRPAEVRPAAEGARGTGRRPDRDARPRDDEPPGR